METPRMGSRRCSACCCCFSWLRCSIAGETVYYYSQRSEIRVPPLWERLWTKPTRVKDLGITLDNDGEMYSDNYAAGQICFMAPRRVDGAAATRL